MQPMSPTAPSIVPGTTTDAQQTAHDTTGDDVLLVNDCALVQLEAHAQRMGDATQTFTQVTTPHDDSQAKAA